MAVRELSSYRTVIATSGVVHLQSDVTFDHTVVSSVYQWIVDFAGGRFAVFTNGILSGNCFIIFAALNLETILFFD